MVGPLWLWKCCSLLPLQQNGAEMCSIAVIVKLRVVVVFIYYI
jgi:hypothetical protein